MLRFLTFVALSVACALPARADNSIGRVNAGGFDRRGMCTGTLVAPDVVLTAAHCVLWPDGRARRIEDMIFVAGWDGAGHAGAARVASVELHPGALDAERRVFLHHDIAVMTLVEPLDLPTIAIGSAQPDGPFTLAGYKRSRPHRLSVTTGCLGSRRGQMWRVDCEIEKGQSGGPVLYGEGEARRVVALITALKAGVALAVPIDGWTRAAIAARR